MDVKKYRNENDNVQHLLVAVCSFSRQASVPLLKCKSKAEVEADLGRVFSELE